jgi:hypothetical protein
VGQATEEWRQRRPLAVAVVELTSPCNIVYAATQMWAASTFTVLSLGIRSPSLGHRTHAYHRLLLCTLIGLYIFYFKKNVTYLFISFT